MCQRSSLVSGSPNFESEGAAQDHAFTFCIAFYTGTHRSLHIERGFRWRAIAVAWAGHVNDHVKGVSRSARAETGLNQGLLKRSRQSIEAQPGSAAVNIAVNADVLLNSPSNEQSECLLI